MARKHISTGIAGIICFLIFLAGAVSLTADERFIVRLTSFQNDLIIVNLRLTTGKPQITMIQGKSCLGADCNNKYNLAADLAIVGDRIKDIAINNVIQSSSVKISGVCSDIVDQNGTLGIQMQRSFNFPTAARHTGIPIVHIYKGPTRYHIAFFKFTNTPGVIAHATGNFNPTNCNTSGPFKNYYTVVDNEFETSPKSSGPILGAITKKADGFELYYVNVATGFVGETELNIPGGTSVNVASAYLAVGPESTAPGAAGIPTNQAFLLYRLQRVQGNTFQSSILLQPMQVQGDLLVSTGTPKTIAPFTTTATPGAENVHSVALGPNGNFALYTAYSAACKKEILKFQKLNPNTGAKIGGPVTLLDCAKFANSLFGAYAIDLLPLED